MFFASWRNVSKSHGPHGQTSSRQNVILRYPRSIWTVSTAISLLSARHLLLVINFHFPWMLYCTQLGVATSFVTLSFFLDRTSGRTHDDGERFLTSILPRLRCGTLVMGVSMIFTALSTLCLLQATLWFYNLPTIVMLGAIAYLVEDLSLLLIGLTSLSTLEASRTISLLLSCAAILVTDYRLAVKGLVPCILGMLFAGIAATLRRVANTYDPEDIPTRSVEFRRYVAVGYVVAIIWPVCFPDEVKYFSYDLSLDLRTICVLLLHGLSSTLSYWVGRSLISPSIEPSASDHGSEASLFPSLPDAATLLGVAGLVGNGTMLVAHRSFTSWPQYLCFAVAVLSISCGRPSLIGAPDVKSSSGGTTYELVELDPLISPREIESGASEGSVTPRAIPARSDRASSWFLYARSQLTSAIMIVLWTSFAIQNFSGQAIKSESVSFDKDYKAGSQMNVVISMYKEPVEDVRQLIDLLKSEWMDSDPDFTIYVKDEDADIENIRHRLGVKRIIPRPNVGRESETYLYHILNNWDNLAFRTTFIQADVHNPREFTPRIKLFDARRTGFLNLSWQDLCECGSCGDKFFWHDNTGLFPKIHDQIHSNGCNYMSIGYKGQFVVSAARIRGINKSIYNDLWQGFVNESSWAHQPEFLQGRADSMNAPHLGYTLERMWNLLFQCSDSNVAWKCSSLLSGHRIGGGLGDCQCFD